MEPKNIVFSKTIIVQVLGLIAGVLALPELQSIIGASSTDVLQGIIAVQGALTVLLRVFAQNPPLSILPKQK